MKHGPPKILVIADDFTGAAEIAGIGVRFGLPTRLVSGAATGVSAGLTVVDTDSRSLSPADATARVRQAIAPVEQTQFDLVYKKVDSVLRGPVLAELEAALAGLGRHSAVLLPQNPSRGRTIAGGVYSIDGIPLHLTGFANDPEYPARSSFVRERLGLAASSDNIVVPDAGCMEDIDAVAASVDSSELCAGGADFFAAMLRQLGLEPASAPKRAARGPTLLVCGTTAAGRDEALSRSAEFDLPVCVMPDAVFDDSDAAAEAADRWVDLAAHAIDDSGWCSLLIDRPVDGRPGVAARVQAALAVAAGRLIERCRPQTILMEGGATASAVCRHMGWTEFDIVEELSGGIVRLQPRGFAGSIVVKPGSYLWPAVVWVVSPADPTTNMATSGGGRFAPLADPPRRGLAGMLERVEMGLGVMVAGVFSAGLGLVAAMFCIMMFGSGGSGIRPAPDTVGALLALMAAAGAAWLGFRGIVAAFESEHPEPGMHLALMIRRQPVLRRWLSGATGLFTGMGALALAEFWSLLFAAHSGTVGGQAMQWVGTMVVLIGGAYAGNAGMLSFLSAVGLPMKLVRLVFKARHLLDFGVAMVLAIINPVGWLAGK